MKGFYYDTLLEAENICNLERERAQLSKGIAQGKKLVVFGPRNFGKTSLVKNVIIPKFKQKKKKSFVLFADLMEVKSLEAIHQRIRLSFEKAFANSFPAKNLLEWAKRLLRSLRPEFSLDPLTTQPVLTISAETTREPLTFLKIFSVIGEEISPAVETLIVLDEFQDIAHIPEAQGLMRQALQEFKNIPIILMGSKRHLLSRIFSLPNAPLASFGEDIEFGPIPYEDYHRYIQERFRERKLVIGFEDAKILQETLFRIPEAINIVCHFLYSNLFHKTVGTNQIFWAMDQVVESRRSRYEELVSLFTENEEAILVALAKSEAVIHPTGKEFLKKVGVSQRSVKMILDHFLDKSLVDRGKEGYRVNDPLLYYFLRKFR